MSGSKNVREAAAEGILSRLANKACRISTQNALLWGVAWLIISTIGGWYLCLAPVGVVGYDVVGVMPLWWHLMINAVVWIISSSVLYVVVLFYNRGAKVTESYGRLLFAHWPATLLLVPVMIVGKVKYCLLYNDLAAAFSGDAITAVLFALFVVIVVAWMWYWSYSVFRHLAGRGGWATLIGFVVGYWLSSLLTQWVVEAVCRGVEIG